MNLCLAHAKNHHDQFWLQQRNFSSVIAQGHTVSVLGWPLAGGRTDRWTFSVVPAFVGWLWLKIQAEKDRWQITEMTNSRELLASYMPLLEWRCLILIVINHSLFISESPHTFFLCHVLIEEMHLMLQEFWGKITAFSRSCFISQGKLTYKGCHGWCILTFCPNFAISFWWAIKPLQIPPVCKSA